jgi:hypothetical protein
VKKLLPQALMLTLERMLQEPLAGMCFGPSIFFLVRKARDPWFTQDEITVRRLKNGVGPVG